MLGTLPTDLQIARQGRVAIAVGPSQGDGICEELRIDGAEVLRVGDGTLAASHRVLRHSTAVTGSRRVAPHVTFPVVASS